MNKVIHKQFLSYTHDAVAVITARGRRIKPLSVNIQVDTLAVWYEFEPSDDPDITDALEFRTIWTGREFDARGWRYIGTAQLADLVLHVYWRMV